MCNRQHANKFTYGPSIATTKATPESSISSWAKSHCCMGINRFMIGLMWRQSLLLVVNEVSTRHKLWWKSRCLSRASVDVIMCFVLIIVLDLFLWTLSERIRMFLFRLIGWVDYCEASSVNYHFFVCWVFLVNGIRCCCFLKRFKLVKKGESQLSNNIWPV